MRNSFLLLPLVAAILSGCAGAPAPSQEHADSYHQPLVNAKMSAESHASIIRQQIAVMLEDDELRHGTQNATQNVKVTGRSDLDDGVTQYHFHIDNFGDETIKGVVIIPAPPSGEEGRSLKLSFAPSVAPGGSDDSYVRVNRPDDRLLGEKEYEGHLDAEIILVSTEEHPVVMDDIGAKRRAEILHVLKNNLKMYEDEAIEKLY